MARKVEFSILTQGRVGTVLVSYQGYESVTLGLVVHRVVGRNGKPGKDWCITHLRSGRLVRSPSFLTRRVALALAEKLGPLANWDRSQEEIMSVSPTASWESRRALGESVQRLYEEASTL